jgi:hypothetical protein
MVQMLNALCDKEFSGSKNQLCIYIGLQHDLKCSDYGVKTQDRWIWGLRQSSGIVSH